MRFDAEKTLLGACILCVALGASGLRAFGSEPTPSKDAKSKVQPAKKPETKTSRSSGSSVQPKSQNSIPTPRTHVDVQPDKQVPKPLQVSGQVLEKKVVKVEGTSVPNTVVVLKDPRQGKPIVVDLGPSTGIRVDKGSTIVVEGVVTRVRDTQILMAQRVRANGKTESISRQPQAGKSRPAKEYKTR